MTETTILLLWLAGAVAFMGVCVLLCRLPLALHLVVGFAAVVGTLYLACFHAPAEEINLGSSYLIFYFHFPSAFSCLTIFVMSGVISVMQLVSGSLSHDRRAAAAVEVGLLACTITLVTGMIWADAAWGQPWVWHDPRLMTVAIMWFTYAAYIMFRAAMDNPVQRARFSAVLGVIFSINVPVVWFAIRLFGKVSHPMEIEFADDYYTIMKTTQWFGAASFFVLYLGLWRLRYLAQTIDGELERLNEVFAARRI
jgi:heme exporter protein C